MPKSKHRPGSKRTGARKSTKFAAVNRSRHGTNSGLDMFAAVSAAHHALHGTTKDEKRDNFGKDD